MKVFLTGATGYIGNGLARAFVAAGHEVTGLTHRDDNVADLGAAGILAMRGDLADASTFAEGLDGYDAWIHAAIVREDAASCDRNAIDAMLAAARAGSGPRIVVYTSGVWVLGDTGERVANEDWPLDHPAPIAAWRVAHEARVLEAATGDLATAVVRPGHVYGGRGGFIGAMFEDAVTRGVVAYVGEGGNRSPLVHLADMAHLYQLVVEKRAVGVFHGVDGSAPRVATIARLASEAAGKGGVTRSVPLVEARAKLGALADALCLDQAVGCRRAHEVLGWRPARPSFLVGARAAFAEWKQESDR